eukprot:5141599-Pyramimonas_sp.AAC.1
MGCQDAEEVCGNPVVKRSYARKHVGDGYTVIVVDRPADGDNKAGWNSCGSGCVFHPHET